MRPGPNRIRSCPHCGALLRERTITSGNTFGGTVWSDGKEDLPMLPRPPYLVRCETCAHPFVLHKAKVVGEASWFMADEREEAAAWREAPYAEEPDVEAYPEALTAGLADDEETETVLRLLWWRAWNDPVRGQPAEPPPPDDALRANLLRLGTLLDDLVLRAEAARAREAFDAARRLLAESRRGDGLDPEALNRIGTMVEQGSRSIVQLSD